MTQAIAATPSPAPCSAAPTSKATALLHPSLPLDPRLHAWRRDLADIALYGRVSAQHFAAPVPLRGGRASVGVRAAPAPTAEQASELLLGETFMALERRDDWTWGYCAHDGYVGYVPSTALDDTDQPAPTHWVSAPQGLVFAAASIKAPLLVAPPLGSRLALTEFDDRFLAATGGGFIHRRHVRPLGDWTQDPVAVAESLLGTPYLWGGRSRAGIDCSGLVQTSLMACGAACPRDSDMQQELGTAVPEDAWDGGLRRGDLVFFPGHVGLMADATRLIHANAYWMTTVIEPLADVVARLRPDHAHPVVAVRRP